MKNEAIKMLIARRKFEDPLSIFIVRNICLGCRSEIQVVRHQLVKLRLFCQGVPVLALGMEAATLAPHSGHLDSSSSPSML